MIIVRKILLFCYPRVVRIPNPIHRSKPTLLIKLSNIFGPKVKLETSAYPTGRVSGSLPYLTYISNLTHPILGECIPYSSMPGSNLHVPARHNLTRSASFTLSDFTVGPIRRNQHQGFYFLYPTV